MFDSVGSSNNPSAVRRTTFMVVAIAFHVGLVAWLYPAAKAVAEPAKKAPMTVRFYQPPAPPAPPPPAASRRTTHRKKHHAAVKPHTLAVPKVIPKAQPQADSSAETVNDGVPGGVAGGVKGGLINGVIKGLPNGQFGGTGTSEPPPVILRPGMTAPAEVDPGACQPRYPKPAQLAGIHGTVIAEYTVTRSGQVTDIRISGPPTRCSTTRCAPPCATAGSTRRSTRDSRSR